MPKPTTRYDLFEATTSIEDIQNTLLEKKDPHPYDVREAKYLLREIKGKLDYYNKLMLSNVRLINEGEII